MNKIFEAVLSINEPWYIEDIEFDPGKKQVDWAFSGPIPWRAEKRANGGTVHLRGMCEEIIFFEQSAWKGKYSERQFVILAQPSQFDPTRCPAWTYFHVPNGLSFDYARMY